MLCLETNEGRKDILEAAEKVQSFEKNISLSNCFETSKRARQKRVAYEPLLALLRSRSERSTREVRKRVSDVMLEVQDIV